MADADLGQRILDLWDFRDPAGSQIRLAEAAEAETDTTRRQSLMTQVARAQGLQKNYEAGHATLDSVGDPEALDDEPGARLLLERGRLHNSAR